MSDTADSTAVSPFPTEPLQFHYIKSANFRVVHVDGATGSITPRGLIHAALFSERMPIPRMAAHKIGADGRIGPPLEQEVRSGIVREVEVSLLMDRNVALSMRDWLTDQIAALDKAIASSGAAPSPTGVSAA
jgi:hypothetical protein